MSLLNMFGSALVSSRPVPQETHSINLKHLSGDAISEANYVMCVINKKFGKDPKYEGKAIVAEKESDSKYNLNVFNIRKHADKYNRMLASDKFVRGVEYIPHPTDRPKMD
ncbi:hypothetical protein KW787_02315 [Candidatus Pacearchaeota archaeon]|nr:hypothetical protein [Candidatus Pacearchaeota archaeon]